MDGHHRFFSGCKFYTFKIIVSLYVSVAWRDYKLSFRPHIVKWQTTLNFKHLHLINNMMGHASKLLLLLTLRFETICNQNAGQNKVPPGFTLKHHKHHSHAAGTLKTWHCNIQCIDSVYKNQWKIHILVHFSHRASNRNYQRDTL